MTKEKELTDKEKLPPGVGRSVYPENRPKVLDDKSLNEWLQYIHRLSDQISNIHKYLK